MFKVSNSDLADKVNKTSIASKHTTKSISLKLAIAIIVLVSAATFVLGTRAVDFGWIKTNSSLDLSSVTATYRALKKNFSGTLDQQTLIDGANRGLVESVNDPYTVFFTAKEANQFNSDLEGEFDGIGAEIGKQDNKLLIISVLDDSPAKQAGLKARDVILNVNAESTSGWSIDKAVAKIRGPKGTTVKLTISRDGAVPHDFNITRQHLSTPSVTSSIKNNIGIMRITRFGETDTADLAKKIAQKFVNSGVSGVVVDLRGNGGGFLQAAVDVAGLWLPNNQTVVTERRGDKVIDKLLAEGDTILKNKPTIVLIDGGSASASEILAGALHDHKAAKLVGVTSFGKGSVQQIIDLPGGAALKVTIAEWFTPNGQNINHSGIKPDITVKDDATTKTDPQLDKAIDLLAG